MKKTVKSEIKNTVKKALSEVVQQLKITEPSRKARKAISRASKALRADLKAALKNEIKRATKPSKTSKVKETAMATA
jgi:hypothetical protein